MNLRHFVYLNERLYCEEDNKETKTNTSICVISVEQDRLDQRKELLFSQSYGPGEELCASYL